MRKLILILSILILGGCAATLKPAFHSAIGEEVYLDPYHTWYNPSSEHSPLSSITLRLINKKYHDVSVEVSCHFSDDGVLYGKRTVSVKKRDDKVFVVRGFPRPYFSERVSCSITHDGKHNLKLR